MDSIQVINNVSDYNFMSSIISWLLSINYGSIASILGFLLSLYVAINVYNVNRYLFIKKRLPQYLKNFESYASTINQLAGNFLPNKETIVDEITKCYSDTKNIRKKVPRILKPEISLPILSLSSSRKPKISILDLRSMSKITLPCPPAPNIKTLFFIILTPYY